MKHTGIACISALVAGFALFQGEAEPLGPSEAAVIDLAGAAAADVAVDGAAAQPEPAASPPVGPSAPEVQEVRVEALRAVEPEPEAPPESRRRWRSRNIYPGPIPTPADWAPPEGPVRVALQAGHWRANEAPDELRGLRDNGTSSRGKAEWEANLEIARRAAALLEPLGYEVDVLPAVVPPGYRAHLFIAIHADGSNDPRATGYRVAAPRRDATGRADEIASILEQSYGEATGIRRLPAATRRMSNYYAFNFRRYQHALHPMTVAVILETGFLTSASDWEIIVEDPDRAARGIVEAVQAFHVTALPQSAEPTILAVD